MLDVLMSISGQIYITVGDKLIQNNDSDAFSELLSIIKNGYDILKKQKKCLNSSMNHILIKCLKFKPNLKEKHQ